ncbi:MAG TPA: hypothetical protein VF855_10280, partial [Acidimicrobiales bacterium]
MSAVMALDELVEQLRAPGAVEVRGARGRAIGGAVTADRVVQAPAGIVWLEPAEMTVGCGAGTPVSELLAALANHGQTLAMPEGGTVGGA